MRLFKRTSKQDRLDGYNAYTAQIVCLFQQTIEQEISSMPASEQASAYEGLRLALLKARSVDFHFIGYEQDDLIHLRSIFNNVVFAANEVAYIAR
jgi:hypothetical protein